MVLTPRQRSLEITSAYGDELASPIRSAIRGDAESGGLVLSR